MMSRWFLALVISCALSITAVSVASADMIGVNITWQRFHAYGSVYDYDIGHFYDSKTDSVPVSVTSGLYDIGVTSYASAGYNRVRGGTNAYGGVSGYGLADTTYHFKPTADTIDVTLWGTGWTFGSV